MDRKSQYRPPVAQVSSSIIQVVHRHVTTPTLVWETLILGLLQKTAMECTRREAGLLAVSSMGTATLHEGQLEGWHHWSSSGFYFLQRQFCLNGPSLSTTLAILFPSPSACTDSQGHSKSGRWSTQRYHPICSLCSGTRNPETWKAAILEEDSLFVWMGHEDSLQDTGESMLRAAQHRRPSSLVPWPINSRQGVEPCFHLTPCIDSSDCAGRTLTLSSLMQRTTDSVLLQASTVVRITLHEGTG